MSVREDMLGHRLCYEQRGHQKVKKLARSMRVSNRALKSVCSSPDNLVRVSITNSASPGNMLAKSPQEVKPVGAGAFDRDPSAWKDKAQRISQPTPAGGDPWSASERAQPQPPVPKITSTPHAYSYSLVHTSIPTPNRLLVLPQDASRAR